MEHCRETCIKHICGNNNNPVDKPNVTELLRGTNQVKINLDYIGKKPINLPHIIFMKTIHNLHMKRLHGSYPVNENFQQCE